MRSLGSAAATVVVLALHGGAAAQPSVTAQARTLYEEARAREVALRKQLEAHEPGDPAGVLLERIRTLAGAYYDMSRLLPPNSYSDNALWQGALLAADAFRAFGDEADRETAQRLLNALLKRFPSSSLVARVPAELRRLRSMRARPSPPSSLLTGIRRDVLPEVLRITLDLSRETTFHDERLDGPPRVFVDLYNTRTIEALKDAVMSFPDDVVRRVRIGRHPDGRTRVVFDLEGDLPAGLFTGRHSVYAIYNPYRLVIDFERRAAPSADPVEASDAKPPAPATTVSTAPTASAASQWVAAPPLQAASLPAPLVAPPPRPPAANIAGGYSLSRQLGLGVSRIVIDPGHGGHDPGARARGLTEADLVLDIALRLERLLLQQPGVEVVLTRRADVYVALEERTAIANRVGADLFLSIHANASRAANARGVETYVLNFATNPEAEAVAARENAGSSKTMSSLPEIVRAIALNNKIDESLDLARMVQAALYERLRRVDRNTRSLGVKQAPFMVLVGATMPGVLAEIAFLTNSREAALLKTERYRQQIAQALFDGIMRYQRSLKQAATVATK